MKTPPAFRYQVLAERFAATLKAGTLKAGDALPSVRQLSRQEKVSPSTVIEAYGRLEAMGLIAAKPKSGFYVLSQSRSKLQEPLVSAPKASPIAVDTGDRISQMLSPDRMASLVPLGAAVPAIELLPTLGLQRSAQQALRLGRHSLHTYDLPPGSLELRRQIARRSLVWGGSLSPQDIVITSGCLEALNLCLRAVCKSGDVVAIESPTYFAILQAMENLGIQALEIPTHPRTGIELGALKAAVARHKVKACLFTPNFNNPLGACMPDATKRELVEWLAKKGIPLIEDDVHGDLHFGPERPRPAQAWDKAGWVMHCSSFSKSLAPGARVGWVSPGRYLDAVVRLKLMNTLATSSIPQAMIAGYLDSGAHDRHLRRLRSALSLQVARMLEAVERHFPAGTRVTRPTGGFNLWVELPKGSDSLTLSDLAAKQGISIAPGPLFSAQGRFKNCIRLSCGNPWSSRLEAAVATLGRLASRLPG
jgi:DNA-binding transcriptional MocR family regulator